MPTTQQTTDHTLTGSRKVIADEVAKGTFTEEELVCDLKDGKYILLLKKSGRLRIFWEDNLKDGRPPAEIQTAIITRTPEESVFRAVVSNYRGKATATGTASATRDNKGRKVMTGVFSELAETRAVMRALELLGYGLGLGVAEDPAPTGDENAAEVSPVHHGAEAERLNGERVKVDTTPAQTGGPSIHHIKTVAQAADAAGVTLKEDPRLTQPSENPVCEKCGTKLGKATAIASIRRTGRELCPAHQQEAKAA